MVYGDDDDMEIPNLPVIPLTKQETKGVLEN